MSIKTGGGVAITSTRVSSSSVRPPGYQYPTGLTFLGSGTGNVVDSFTSTSTWVAPTGVTSIDYLVIAGGGGGGSSGGNGGGGGGGAGGFLTGTGQSVTPGTSYTITIGAGGAPPSGYGNGGSGIVIIRYSI